jgi:hypothetical protein
MQQKRHSRRNVLIALITQLGGSIGAVDNSHVTMLQGFIEIYGLTLIRVSLPL